MVQAVTVGVPSWNDLGGGTTPVGSPITVFAHTFPGATAGDKINNAINSLPATGGIVDATGFTGNQTIASTVLLYKPIQLVVGCTTFSGSADPLVSITSPNCVITSNFPKCTCFQQTTAPANNIRIGPGVTHTLIENICAENTGPLPPTPGGQLQQYIAIWAAGALNQTITDLTVRNCLIGNGTAQMVLEWTDYSYIRGNEFVANAPLTTGGSNPGIVDALVVAGSHNVIDGNTFQTTGYVSSIILNSLPFVNQASFPGANYNVICNNTLIALTPLNNEAINVFTGAFNTISNNTLKLATLSNSTGQTVGIALYTGFGSQIQPCHFNAIVGNSIDMADGNFGSFALNIAGILLGDHNGVGVNYNSVVGNTISTPGKGITLGGASHNVINGNTVLITGGSSGVDGIDISSNNTTPLLSSTDDILKGNTIVNATGYGQIVVGPGTSGLIIEGNRIIGNPSVITNGVVIGNNAGGANTQISGNLFSTNLNFGIYVDPGSDSNISIGLNSFVQADIHLGNINIATAPSHIAPISAAHIRMASDSTAGMGITLVNSVTANRTWNFQDATDTVVGRQTTDTLLNKILDSPQIDVNLSPNGTGVKRAGANFGNVAANSSLVVVQPWFGTAFADANYAVFGGVSDFDNSGLLSIWGFTQLTPTSVTVTIHNNDTVNQHAGSLYVLGIHF